MSSPRPPNPPTSTTTTTTTATGIFSNPPPQAPLKAANQTLLHHTTTATAFPPPTQRQQTLHSNSKNHQPQSAAGGILCPVGSSGKGFLPNHNSDKNTAVAAVPNSGGFPSRPVSTYPFAVHRPYGYIHGQTFHHLVKPSSAQLQQTLLDRSTGGGMVAPNSVSANPEVVADGNGFKDLRDKSGDDTFVTIRDRKVQVSEGASLYALCRSWLKNGFTENNQPQYLDCVTSLPKPLPASMVEVSKEDDKEKEEEISEDVEHLSTKELLQQHVNRAKKVRARFRNQRLQRVERYKGRLALLLPPPVEPHQKHDDSAAGN